MPSETPPSRRLVSLDVLRGVAILLMILSGMLPKTLPNWVDHGYQPHFRPDASGAWVSTLVNGTPPFDPRWKAFTWVDLVFPMFLFAMGAAIPLAMSRRMSRGTSRTNAIAGAAARAGTLALFAVIVTQMTTWQLSWPGGSPDAARGRALLGLVGAFLFFVRWPTTTRPMIVVAARAIGLAIIVGLITLGVRYGTTFGWNESDIIILVLATTYLVAAVVWSFTRSWGWWRLLAIAPLLLASHYLQLAPPSFADWRWLGDLPLTIGPIATWPGRALNVAAWLPGDWSETSKRLLNFSPFWNATWLKFLWCVVPGTIVGDELIAWSRRERIADDDLPRRTILAMAIAIVAATCVGFRHYGFPLFGFKGPLATPWLAITLAGPLLAWMTIVVLRRSRDVTHRRLMITGAIVLGVGLLLACLPSATAREGFFEGGISKGSPATLSYYAVSVGLCILLLLGLLVTIDESAVDPRPRLPGILEANGQNPLLAYYLAHTTVGAIFTFSLFANVNQMIGANLALATVWGVLKTLLIAVVVWSLTRWRIVWRA